MRSAKYLPALKSMRPAARTSPGERVIASLFPNNRMGWPGWGDNRYEQVCHYRAWVYVVIDLIASKIASLTPNIAYVTHAAKPGVTVKAGQRGLMNLMGRGFGGSPYIGGRYERQWMKADGKWYPQRGDVEGEYVGFDSYRPQELVSNGGGSSFLTVGEYRGKALSVIKPHEELEPIESDHHLRSIIDNPNPVDTFFDVEYELTMFEELCGVSYEWIPPNEYGRPAERWCMPSHWVWPMTGGGRWNSAEDQRLIKYYQIRPWGGLGAQGHLDIPADEIIMQRWKSPLNKIDGYSRLTAGAQSIDLDESIRASRWSQVQNVARPELWIELGPGYEDVNDSQITRIESKMSAKLQGEYNYGRPLITPPGAKVMPLSFTPTEMAYGQSSEQSRVEVCSLWKVPPAAIGIVTEMTFGSILATLGSMCDNCLNPRLVMRGQTRTKFLAKRWDETQGHGRETSYPHGPGSSQGRKVRYWYDDCVPTDPEQVNSDLREDRACFAVTPNEVRALRGRKPYRFGGDNPWVQGEVTPFLANDKRDVTEESEEKLPMGGLPPLGPGPEAPSPEGPGIEAPNGPPGKRLKRVVQKSKVLAHIAGASGSGKTTLGEKLHRMYPELNVQDLDEFDDRAVEQLGWSDVPKSEFTDDMLQELAVRRQKLADEYLATVQGPVVFVGLNREGDHEIVVPTDNKFMLDVDAETAARRALARSQHERPEHRRTEEELPRDVREAQQDIDWLLNRGYQPASPESIEQWVGQQMKPTKSLKSLAETFLKLRGVTK